MKILIKNILNYYLVLKFFILYIILNNMFSNNKKWYNIKIKKVKGF